MKTKRHSIDTKDPTLKTLVDFAARIVKLLETAHAASNDELVGALDDLLGAVYALISAKEEGFKGKGGASEFAVALDRAKDVVNGETFADGNWMAGFHFNSAMFRISAVFDRLPRALACCRPSSTCVVARTAVTPPIRPAPASNGHLEAFRRAASARTQCRYPLSGVTRLVANTALLEAQRNCRIHASGGGRGRTRTRTPFASRSTSSSTVQAALQGQTRGSENWSLGSGRTARTRRTWLSGGRTRLVVSYERSPQHLRGLALVS